jgi:hypothetical protein
MGKGLSVSAMASAAGTRRCDDHRRQSYCCRLRRDSEHWLLTGGHSERAEMIRTLIGATPERQDDFFDHFEFLLDQEFDRAERERLAQTDKSGT